MKHLPKTRHKKPSVVPIIPSASVETPFDPPIQPSDSAESVPDPAHETPSEAAEPQKRGPGRPPKDAQPTVPRFWDLLTAIPEIDWQENRAFLYLYQLEPKSIPRTDGQPVYVQKYFNPIDPDRVKAEHGSGKYWLILKRKKGATKQDETIGDITFEICDGQYPPKMPRAMWENDPRNARWIALLPKEKKPGEQPDAPDPAKIFTSGVETAFKIQDGIAARSAAQSTRDDGILGKLVETLIKPPSQPAAPAQDPMVQIVALTEKIMSMRADNPMVDVLKDEMKAMREEMAKLRENNIALQTSLMQAKLDAIEAKISQQAPKGGILEQAKELATVLGVQPADMLKRFVGAEEGAVKSKMTGWMELLSEVVPSVMNSPLANALAMKLNPAQTPPPPGSQPAQTPRATPIPGSFEDLSEFAGTVVNPAMLQYIMSGDTGGDFAQWLWNGHPERLKQLQQLTHPMMPGQKGAPVILEVYKRTPLWETLRHREQQFTKFIADFCAWNPPAPGVAEEEEDGEDESVSMGDESSGGDF